MDSEDVAGRFGYDLGRRLAEIRPTYRMNLTCPGSVPEAIIAFLESEHFEDAIRNAVSLGGDADTQAAIAGAIAEAFYGQIPDGILAEMSKRLNGCFKRTIVLFCERFGTAGMIAGSLALEAHGRNVHRA